MILLLMLLLSPLQSKLQPQPLFTVTRRTNANVVHYDAQVTPSGTLDPKDPISGYWIMLAERGQREDFSRTEKKSAYGFTVTKEGPGDCYQMTIAAEPKRPIRVCSDRGAVRAEITIDGHRATLERMYIATKGALLWKSVEYIELYGKDAETGVPRHEKIKPE
jgi:Domain of unknown function (DUF4833)